jgi:Protein of unknown function (DUF433)
VLSYLASGFTEQQILTDFSQLTSNDIRACLAFAAERERRLVTIPIGRAGRRTRPLFSRLARA